MSFIAHLLKPRGRAQPKVVAKTVSGPSSYTPGGFTVDFSPELSRLRVATVHAAGGYVFEATAVSGAACRVKAYYVPNPVTISGRPSALVEVASGTDLSNVTVTVVGYGDA